LASAQVTVYRLFLGNQDSITGKYRQGYTITSAEVAIFPRSAQRILSGAGFYCRRDAIGFTEYNVDEGDVLLDDHGYYYKVMGIEPYTWFDQFVCYVLDLARLQDFPFIAGFFGFEVITAGVSEFEEGFERGYWAL
jgi:hypothetical protein